MKIWRSFIAIQAIVAAGLPYLASVVPEGPAVSAELEGVDCNPVRISREEIITVGGKCGASDGQYMYA